MPALVFDKCCGCVELKTGCFILGYLNLVFNIIAVIMTFILILGGAVMTSQGEDEDAKTTGGAILIVSCIILIFVVLNLAFIIVLLVGLHKDKRGHLKAFLVYSMIFIVLSAILAITKMCQGSLPASDIFKEIFNLLLSIYFWLVIRSQYFAMAPNSNKGAVYSHA